VIAAKLHTTWRREPDFFLGTVSLVPKRPKKTFRAGREARRIAREIVGSPPPARVVVNKRTKPPKHKKPLREEIDS
jgi:hypothetical protein